MTAFSDHRPQPDEGHSKIPKHSDVPKTAHTHHSQDWHSGTSPSAIRGETMPSSPTLFCRSRTLSISSVSSFLSSDTPDDVDGPYVVVDGTSSPTTSSRGPEVPFDGQADRDSLPVNTCPGYVEGTVMSDDGTVETVAVPCDHENQRCEALRSDLAARAFQDQATTSSIINDTPTDSEDPHVTNKDHPRRSGGPRKAARQRGQRQRVDSETRYPPPFPMGQFHGYSNGTFNVNSGNATSISVSNVGNCNAVFYGDESRGRTRCRTTSANNTGNFRAYMAESTGETSRARRPAEREDATEERHAEQETHGAGPEIRADETRSEHELRYAMSATDIGRSMEERAQQSIYQHWPQPHFRYAPVPPRPRGVAPGWVYMDSRDGRGPVYYSW